MTLKTFIRWQGNKSKHLRHIIPHIPEEYNTYIEPFVGSGALLLKLEPEQWIINDLNKDLINCWKYIKSDPETIIAGFKKFGKKFKPMSKENKTLYCRELTSKINDMKYDINRAITYMLMKHCSYTGDIFHNNKFYFKGLNLSIYNLNYYIFMGKNCHDNILDISDYINDTKGIILNKDYKTILSKAKAGDFVFMDPPYVEDHDYQFNYNKDEILDESFIIGLLEQVKKLDYKGVKWMMTQADTKTVRNIFKGYKILKFPVYRALKKEYVNELLIKNY